VTITALGASLTTAEAKAVSAYLDATAGIPDTFEGLDADDLDRIERETGGPDGVTDYVALLFKTLDRWHDALDQLHAELALATPTQSSLRPAAEGYVRAEATQFVHFLSLARKAFCDWHFNYEGGGSGPSFRIDGAAITFSNFPPVTLTADIAAEAMTP
jgi:hypothetical protein